ncbi:CPBP family intramembrane glutamic endopeptidase [Actinomyces vulturis]|uniref:CPBP family intramembrane glutamic endopeptidase n=1 Tax=Actinomyces vulturis TaxID=1857645 RepID=UPI000832CDC3|nr:CPBP family intramembrane glutamic endopeptidase [Actinomyces vulturis]
MTHPLDRLPEQSHAKAMILLIVCLIMYAAEWGTSAIRSVECLRDHRVPTGRLIDTLANSSLLTLFVVIGSGLVLFVARVPFFMGNNRQQSFMLSTKVGLVWAGSMVIARFFGAFTPPSSCPPAEATHSMPLFSLEQLAGPAEEIWFGAFLACIVLLTRHQPARRFWIAVIAGGFLRGVFHLYQGWGSAGLFLWGAVTAVAVAWTGRWMILFVMHLINNVIVLTFGVPDLFVAVGWAIVLGVAFLITRSITSSDSLPSTRSQHVQR